MTWYDQVHIAFLPPYFAGRVAFLLPGPFRKEGHGLRLPRQPLPGQQAAPGEVEHRTEEAQQEHQQEGHWFVHRLFLHRGRRLFLQESH